MLSHSTVLSSPSRLRGRAYPSPLSLYKVDRSKAQAKEKMPGAGTSLAIWLWFRRSSSVRAETRLLWIDAAIVDCAAMTVASMSFFGRLWLSWLCGFRILFDARFAARVAELRDETDEPDRRPALTPSVEPVEPARVTSSGALQLLSLLQREGRLVDFVEQEVTGFSDAEIAAAARVVHEGCRRALHSHARVVSVRSEREGAQLTLERAQEDVKLVGNVAGSAPFRGVLRHRGWRVEALTLPTLIGSGDPSLVAQAELEL